MLKVIAPFSVFDKEYNIGDSVSPSDLGIYANDIVAAGCISALDITVSETETEPLPRKKSVKEFSTEKS